MIPSRAKQNKEQIKSEENISVRSGLSKNIGWSRSSITSVDPSNTPTTVWSLQEIQDES